ncbi:hypothetical protein F511_28801 [Dorcoceras hygrometricum]|uniref:Uncharacterized protein n=1 Tax=Dorcoceras hygrometricum TaxID=472368 RepID=A0A2Z7BJ99_9LAMI|nr:hypothetical protein F511_28801 [Dorcoceras hygrometricum]
MSLFDLQDVCIAIGSIATLDLPMVIDLIGIYGLKGPYSLIASECIPADCSTAVRSAVGFLSHNTSRNSWFTFIAIAGKRCSRLVVQTLVLKPGEMMCLRLVVQLVRSCWFFSLRLVHLLLSAPTGLLAPTDLSSYADCDDITADVIIADSRSCASLHNC